MSTSSVTSTAAATTSAASEARTTIAGNLDTFLGLLTTQLRNQNPLDPLDTNQFTQQLVQFAGVEQQIRTNESLESLIALTRTTQATAAMALVGTTITADGAEAELAEGKAEWNFTAPKPGIATLSVLDAQGSTVFMQERAMSAGANTFEWNGKGSTGSTEPDGVYTLSITAKDAGGKTVSVTTQISGVVDGIDVSGATPYLKVGGLSIPLDQVKAVNRT
jgi:flagellar basal-body rod modification protein FlgD